MVFIIILNNDDDSNNDNDNKWIDRQAQTEVLPKTEEPLDEKPRHNLLAVYE